MADGFFASSFSVPNEAQSGAVINLGSPEVAEFGSDLWFSRANDTKSFESTDIAPNCSAPKIETTKYGNGNADEAIELFGDSIVRPASAPHESQGRASEATSNSTSLSNLGSVITGHDVGVGNVEKAAEAAEAVDENENRLVRTLTAFTNGLVAEERSKDLVVIETSDDMFVMGGTIKYAEDAAEDWLKYRGVGSPKGVGREATDDENLVMTSSKTQLGVVQGSGSHDKYDREDVAIKPAASECYAAVSKVTADVLRLGEDFTIERTFKVREKEGDPAVRAGKFKKDVALPVHSGSPTVIPAGQEVVLKEVETRCYRKIEMESLDIDKFGVSVPRFYGIGRSRTRTMLVEESVNGVLLHDVMKQSKKTRLSNHFLYRVTSAMFNAYGKLATNNIAHLDIKPRNVTIRTNDLKNNRINAARTCEACILDFGLSRSMRSRKFMDRPGNVLCGTPEYMSPKMVENIVRSRRNLEAAREQAALEARNHSRLEVIGTKTLSDPADANRTSDGSRGGVVLFSTTEQKDDSAEPQAAGTAASVVDDNRASEAAECGDNIPVRSVMKTEINKLEQNADIGTLNKEAVKAATECKLDGQQKRYLDLGRKVDASSIALTLYGVACGHPYFELKERTFDERVRERSELESGKFDEQTGELVESSFLKELARLESSNVYEDRQRFPKRFVKLLNALYAGKPDSLILKLLGEWYNAAFAGDIEKAPYLPLYVDNPS